MMRSLILAVGLAACSSQQPVRVPVPAPDPTQVTAGSMALDALGDVQPIAVALTNGTNGRLVLDVKQAYAHGADGARIAPLTPAEAARQTGGRSLPGAVERGAVQAAKGGFSGALGAVIQAAIGGAVAGGIGIAAATAAALGAVFGAIGGVTSDGPAPDIAGFEQRALASTTLAPSFSANGYLYYPLGAYQTVELLLTRPDGTVEPVVITVVPRSGAGAGQTNGE
jgi:hypothetical protein